MPKLVLSNLHSRDFAIIWRFPISVANLKELHDLNKQAEQAEIHHQRAAEECFGTYYRLVLFSPYTNNHWSRSSVLILRMPVTSRTATSTTFIFCRFWESERCSIAFTSYFWTINTWIKLVQGGDGLLGCKLESLVLRGLFPCCSWAGSLKHHHRPIGKPKTSWSKSSWKPRTCFGYREKGLWVGVIFWRA